MKKLTPYQEWENSTSMSPVSPEASWAELGWNAALKALREELAFAFNEDGYLGSLRFEEAMKVVRTD